MARFEWRPISRGSEIPNGAILGGRTKSDGDVYVGRNKDGEVGKLNLDNGKMYNIWCNKGGDSADGQILVVSNGCPIQWMPVHKGDPLPVDSLLAGQTSGDGDVYPCRSAGGGAIGKLNVINGKVNNLWYHGEWFGKSDGEILVVGPQGSGSDWANQYKGAKGGEARGFLPWVKDHKGVLIGGALAAIAAGVGIAAAEGAFSGGKTDDVPAAGYSGGDAPSAPAQEPEDQDVPHFHDPEAYNADYMCDGSRAEERVNWLVNEKGLSHEDAVKTVMKEFPKVFWWKPNADCDGLKAKDRAQWLMDNKGMSGEAARIQVKNEFPAVFGGKKAAGGGHFVDGPFPHTLSIVQGADGPKLQIAVAVREPGETSLVAWHYQINDGASMNFETKENSNGTYTHVTPNGGYPTCPPGSRVSYWMGVIVKGLIVNEPHGAMSGARLEWEAH